MTRASLRTAAATLGGISLAAALAGCANSATATSGSASAAPTAAPNESTSAAPTAAAATYSDGKYAAIGVYLSPGGSESISVELTLERSVVTAVTVVGNATAGNALRYQTEFENGIAAKVVGKKIDELKVDKVAGSSLTSGGFNDALAQIKADAVA